MSSMLDDILQGLEESEVALKDVGLDGKQMGRPRLAAQEFRTLLFISRFQAFLCIVRH